MDIPQPWKHIYMVNILIQNILILAITYVLSTQMGRASPFETSTFQKLSSDIRNVSIQWVLTLAIAL
jgi:hypothetical protein